MTHSSALVRVTAFYDPALRAAMALHGFSGARVDTDGKILAVSGDLTEWIGAAGHNAFFSPVFVGMESEFARLRQGQAPRLVLPNLALREGARVDVSIVWLEQEGFYDIVSCLLGANDQIEAALTRERRARRLAQEQAASAKAQAETQSRLALVARERLKIAHDLHDTIVHALVGVVTQLSLVKKLFARQPLRAGEEIERAYEAARDGLACARQALGQVRFERAGIDGLGVALERSALRFEQRTGLQIERDVAPACNEVTGEPAEIVYRIVEEALRNIAAHAQAQRVMLRAKRQEDFLHIELQDDGVGFDADAAHPGHYGLTGMMEQADMIGGRFSVKTSPGQGVALILEAPLYRPASSPLDSLV